MDRTRVDATFRARFVMSVQSRHWLDYDPVALVILVVGIGAGALLALSLLLPPRQRLGPVARGPRRGLHAQPPPTIAPVPRKRGLRISATMMIGPRYRGDLGFGANAQRREKERPAPTHCKAVPPRFQPRPPSP